MKLLMANIRDDRAAWLELRRNSIGSSDIAAIMGFNQFKTPLELWGEKVGRIPINDEESDPQMFGRIVEPALLQFLHEKSPHLEVRRADSTYAHDDYEWMTASPDAWVLDKTRQDAPTGIAEAKFTSYIYLKDWYKEIPYRVQLQLQWQMGVIGAKWGIVAGMVGGDAVKFRRQHFDFDERVFEECMISAEAFHDCMLNNRAPKAGVGDRKIVEKLVGEKKRGKISAIPMEEYPVVKEYLRIQGVRKALEENARKLKAEEDGHAARLLQLIGDAELATTEWGVHFTPKKVTVEPYQNKGSSYTRLYTKGKLIEESPADADSEWDFINDVMEEEGQI